mmetsp:Transcript_25663/g.59712  ORF Transcript_25663/g.59712 Transcript_25663/m.59712 type:complete len:210 (+) Transcript_25663:220-849(+)
MQWYPVSPLRMLLWDPAMPVAPAARRWCPPKQKTKVEVGWPTSEHPQPQQPQLCRQSRPRPNSSSQRAPTARVTLAVPRKVCHLQLARKAHTIGATRSGCIPGAGLAALQAREREVEGEVVHKLWLASDVHNGGLAVDLSYGIKLKEARFPFHTSSATEALKALQPLMPPRQHLPLLPSPCSVPLGSTCTSSTPFAHSFLASGCRFVQF